VIWLIHFLYKNEHKIFKPVEITIRKGLSRKKKSRGDEAIQVIIHICMECSQGNSKNQKTVGWNRSCLGVMVPVGGGKMQGEGVGG
jgi:hypothetical protein